MATSTVMFRTALKLFLIFAIKRPSLVSASSCCYCFHGEDVRDAISTHIYESLHVYQQNTTMRIRPKVTIQILLLFSGDVERCPGPVVDEISQDYEHILHRKGFKMFHLNVRGLWGNLSNITQILSDYKKIDILALGETHIADEPEEMYQIDSYTFVSRPRKNGKGGGVACYIHESINWIRRYDLESEEVECLWIEILLEKSKSLLVSVIYKPPEGSHYLQENFTNLLNLMLSIATKSKKETIVIGDLNVNYMIKKITKILNRYLNCMALSR